MLQQLIGRLFLGDEGASKTSMNHGYHKYLQPIYDNLLNHQLRGYVNIVLDELRKKTHSLLFILDSSCNSKLQLAFIGSVINQSCHCC